MNPQPVEPKKTEPTVEEMVTAMETADEMTEAEIEAGFTDVEPSKEAVLYFRGISESMSQDEVARDE